MFVALTGTPGVGKTSVGGILAKWGFEVIYLKGLENKCVVGCDKKRLCPIFDIEKISASLIEQTRHQSGGLVIVEGHLSHLLSRIDKIIVLRCHPEILRNRLVKKGWSLDKICENVMAEALDVILCEATRTHEFLDIGEIDTTHTRPEDVAVLVKSLLKNGFQGEVGAISWHDWLEKNVG
jgi:adenylate kinase